MIKKKQNVVSLEFFEKDLQQKKKNMVPEEMFALVEKYWQTFARTIFSEIGSAFREKQGEEWA